MTVVPEILNLTSQKTLCTCVDDLVPGNRKDSWIWNTTWLPFPALFLLTPSRQVWEGKAGIVSSLSVWYKGPPLTLPAHTFLTSPFASNQRWHHQGLNTGKLLLIQPPLYPHNLVRAAIISLSKAHWRKRPECLNDSRRTNIFPPKSLNWSRPSIRLSG